MRKLHLFLLLQPMLLFLCLLLNLLLQHPNTYIPQERIFETLWDMGQEPSELSLRAYIKNLRKLIGKHKIVNQHNKGYCYVR